MIHPGDPRYIAHNEQLAKVRAEGREAYLTKPDIQDIRASEWEESFRENFPGIGKSAFLEKFREVAGYDPMVPGPEGEERFVEEWGFIPTLVF